MIIYYSKLKALWNELNLYSPIPPCNYESNKTLKAYEDKDRTMYMGVCGQILLMDPILVIGKVFSLLFQEKRQQGILRALPS